MLNTNSLLPPTIVAREYYDAHEWYYCKHCNHLRIHSDHIEHFNFVCCDKYREALRDYALSILLEDNYDEFGTRQRNNTPIPK